MAGISGFSRYPQSPTPDSRAVGDALAQQGQQAPATSAPPPGDPNATPGLTPAAQLRADGAHRMTAPGQMDDMRGEDTGDMHSHNALSIAVGEALTRMGGGYATNPNPLKPSANNMRQLQQMGLSAVEAQLLHQTGGI